MARHEKPEEASAGYLNGGVQSERSRDGVWEDHPLVHVAHDLKRPKTVFGEYVKQARAERGTGKQGEPTTEELPSPRTKGRDMKMKRALRKNCGLLR